MRELSQTHRHFEELVTPYCFGDASEDERIAFEIHLLECDRCWDEVQRLEAAVQLLRRDRTLLAGMITPATFGLLGLSGRTERIFGGHHWHVIAGSFLYASLFAISLVFQVFHDFSGPHQLAWWAAGLVVLPGMWLTTLLVLWIDWKLTLENKMSGLAVSFGISCFAVAVLVGAVAWFFRSYFPTAVSTDFYPTPMDYLKGAAYYWPYTVLFLFVPFHFVVVAQRQLQKLRHRQVFALISGDKEGITPRGAFFPKVWMFGIILAAIGILSVPATATLFDQLKQDSSKSLLMFLILLRNFCYFALGVECLIWYSRSLDELKRECIAVLKDLPFPTF